MESLFSPNGRSLANRVLACKVRVGHKLDPKKLWVAAWKPFLSTGTLVEEP